MYKPRSNIVYELENGDEIVSIRVAGPVEVCFHPSIFYPEHVIMLANWQVDDVCWQK